MGIYLGMAKGGMHGREGMHGGGKACMAVCTKCMHGYLPKGG